MTEHKKLNLVGLIPAAGKGTRLAPFPCPKELFPVGYQDYTIEGVTHRRPKVVSQYLIENIIRAGASKLFMIVGEGKGDLMKYYGCGEQFNADICYLYQDEPRGMPEALALANPWIDSDQTVIFGMPDTIIEPANNFSQLLNFHQQENADLTLGLFQTTSPRKFGMVCTDELNNVVYTVDKPEKSKLTFMWGSACWNHKFSQLIKEVIESNKDGSREIVLGDVFNLAIEKELRVKGCIVEEGKYMDIGTSEELDEALKRFHL